MCSWHAFRSRIKGPQNGRWSAAGLPRETWVKPTIGTLSVSIIAAEIGVIETVDWGCVAHAFGLMLAERIRFNLS